MLNSPVAAPSSVLPPVPVSSAPVSVPGERTAADSDAWVRRELLERIVSALNAPEPAGVAVIGGPGVGKTYLARRALEQLGRAWDQIQVQGSSIAASMPYGALRSLLNEANVTATLPPLQVVEALAGHLRERGRARRVVLLVDNIEGLDELAALAINRLAVHKVVKVLVVGEDLVTAPGELVSLWKDQLLERIDVEAFSQDETAHWLRAACASEVSAAASDALWTATRGNPRMLEVALAEQIHAGTIVCDDGIQVLRGREFEYSVSARQAESTWLAPVTDSERQVLELVALSEGLPLDVLARLSDVEAIDSLRGRGFLSDRTSGGAQIRLAAPMMQQILRKRVPSGRSRELHRMVAGSCGRDGKPVVPALPMASWTLECGEPLSSDAALDAARLANRSGHPFQALRFIEAVEPAHRGAAAAEEVRAHFALGDPAKAEALVDAALEAASDVERWVELMLLRSRIVRSRSGRGQDARTALDEVQARLDQQEDGVLESRLREELALAEAELHLFEGRYRQAADKLHQLYGQRSGGDDRLEAGMWLAEAWTITGRQEDAAALLEDLDVEFERAEGGASRPPTLERALMNALLAESVAAGSQESMTVMGELTHARVAAVRELVDGVADAYCGRAAAALARLLPALAQLRRLDSTGAVAVAVAATAYAYALLRNTDNAKQYLHSSTGDSYGLSGLSGSIRSYFEVVASAELASRDKANVRLLELADEERRRGGKLPELLQLCAAVRRGCWTVAPRLESVSAAVQGPFARLCHSYATGIKNRNAAVLLQCAEAAAVAGDDLFARDAARAAQKFADDASDRTLVRAARRCINASLQRMGVPQSDEDGPALTAREQEIAQRAALGESNRQIAATMSISVRTVEGHLYQIYSKLHVASRAELKLVLA